MAAAASLLVSACRQGGKEARQASSPSGCCQEKSTETATCVDVIPAPAGMSFTVHTFHKRSYRPTLSSSNINRRARGQQQLEKSSPDVVALCVGASMAAWALSRV